MQISFLRPSGNFCVYTSDPINSCISYDFSFLCFNCQNPKYGEFYNAGIWNEYGVKLLSEETLKRKKFFIISNAPFTIVDIREQSLLMIKQLNKKRTDNTQNFSFEEDLNYSKNSGLDFLITLIKKDKIIYKKAKNTNLYVQHDMFSVGYVINLNNAQNLNTQFSYYLKDKKTTDELKSIKEYKVRGEFSELK